MLLDKAIALQLSTTERDGRCYGAHSFLPEARALLVTLDRFLRHNGFEEAAKALHTEHMP